MSRLRVRRVLDFQDDVAKRLARLLYRSGDGVHIGTLTHDYDTAGRRSRYTLEVAIEDRALIEEGEEMSELEHEDDITAVERPSSHTITVIGVCNLEVRWDKGHGLFRLTSVCPSCGRSFERTLRGFTTKELVTLAHELGFKLGEHLERHQTFGDYLKNLKRQGG